jgi:NAD(P)-dependent dehydrogenase (short-subunit alcohol dehydrogenase family)
MAGAAALAGRVVLVTGVGRAGQIGHAVARGLGQAGARVVLAGRDAAALEVHQKTFAGEGLDARVAAGDLADPRGAAAAVQAAVDAFGGLDGVAALAGGFTAAGPIADIPVAALDDAFAQNVRTAFCVCQAAAPALRARGGGAIVLFASIAALKPMKHTTGYTAAKAAVAGMARALALELRDDHIRVNALAPGTVRTADNVAAMGGANVRWVELDQIVAAVRYLLSDEARAVTGQVLGVSAGDL